MPASVFAFEGGRGFIRFDANTLEQRNSTTAQVTRWYESFTSHSDYSRLALLAGDNGDFTFITQAAGSGAVRHLVFGTGTTKSWFINSTNAHLQAYVDDTFDVGTRLANRPRAIYAATLICTKAFVMSCTSLGTTCTALTAFNGASTATLTNAPVSGNPQTWAKFNNNGCEYFVPLWR